MREYIKKIFHFISIHFISYGLVGYMINLVYVNWISFSDPQKYIDNISEYSFQVGLCIWSSLFYFFISFKLPYCKETRVLSLGLLAMTILYKVRGLTDDVYNRNLQLILGSMTLIIYFLFLGYSIKKNKTCKLYIFLEYMKYVFKHMNCRIALQEYLKKTRDDATSSN